jgi:L-fuculose-phosphate aldolase
METALKPSSEIKMHLAIYRQSPEILAVCHAHPPVSSAFAAAGVALDKAYLQETAVSLGVIPVAKYAKPGTSELAYGAAEFCLEYHGVLLEHHGPVTWGDSVIQALFRMESIEYSATIAMYSRMLGFDRTLNKEQIAQLITIRPQLGITASLGEFR